MAYIWAQADPRADRQGDAAGKCVRAGAPAGIAYPSALEGKQLVPQLLVPPGMMPPPQGAARLTAAQAAELEMARRRAQKVWSPGLPCRVCCAFLLLRSASLAFGQALAVIMGL